MANDNVQALLNLLKRFDCFDSSVKDEQLWFSGNIDGKPLTLTVNIDGARELWEKEFWGMTHGE